MPPGAYTSRPRGGSAGEGGGLARALMIVGFAALLALAWPRLAPLREAVAGLLAPEVEAGRYAEAVVEGLRDGPDAGAPYAPPEGDFAALSFVADGAARRWHLQAPRPADALPAAIVLLHGAPGRDGRAMLDMWRGAGDVLLIAPDSADPRGWSGAADGPAFMAALLEDAARVHPFDLERVFLMGHSAGAIQATGLANRDGPWRPWPSMAASCPASGCDPGPTAPPSSCRSATGTRCSRSRARSRTRPRCRRRATTSRWR